MVYKVGHIVNLPILSHKIHCPPLTLYKSQVSKPCQFVSDMHGDNDLGQYGPKLRKIDKRVGLGG